MNTPKQQTRVFSALALVTAVSMLAGLGQPASLAAERIVLDQPLRVKLKPTKEGRKVFSPRKNIGNYHVHRTIRTCDERRVEFTDGLVCEWTDIEQVARYRSIYYLVNRLYTHSRSAKMLDVAEHVLGVVSDGRGLADQAKFRQFKQAELERIRSLPRTLHPQRVVRPVEVGFHLTEETEERTGLDPYADSGGIFLRGYDERGAEFLGATGYVWRLDWTDIKTPWIVPGIFQPLLRYDRNVSSWQLVDRILARLPNNGGSRKLVGEAIDRIKAGKVLARPTRNANPQHELKIVTVLETKNSRRPARDVTAWPEFLEGKQPGTKVVISNINELKKIAKDNFFGGNSRHDVDVVVFSMGGWRNPGGGGNPVVHLSVLDEHGWAAVVESVSTRVDYARMLWPDAKIVIVMPPRVYPEKADARKYKKYMAWLVQVPKWHAWLAQQYAQLAKEKDALFINAYDAVDQAHYAGGRGYPWFSFNDAGHAQLADAIWSGLPASSK